MDKKNTLLHQVFHKIRTDLRSFIDLSMQEDPDSWVEWVTSVDSKIDVKCWERKNCKETGCPAYKNSCRRCWIIAGTFCAGEIHGKFAQKYKSCQTCDIYLDSVLKNPITEIQEHLIILVHSLRAKQAELERIATTDSLTGLLNRNYFDMTIYREMEKAKRSQENILFYMIDIDEFKYFNDTYGHVHGDVVLKESADILKKSVRSSDMLIRYGGDEFLVVMSPEVKDERNNFKGRIKNNLANWNRLNAKPDYNLSFSIGSSILEPGTKLEDALHEADRDMYKDKNSKNGKSLPC